MADATQDTTQVQTQDIIEDTNSLASAVSAFDNLLAVESGDVEPPKKAKAEEETSEEPAETEELEATDSEDEQTEAEEEAVEASEKQEETKQEPEATDEELPQTLSEIAQALELKNEDEFLEKFKVNVKIEGSDEEVSLKEAKNGYLRESDYTRKTKKLAEIKKSIESEKANLSMQQQNNSQAAEDMIRATFARLENVYTKNPEDFMDKDFSAEWKIAQQELSNDLTALQQARQQAFQQQSQDVQQQQQQYLEENQQQLLTAIPEWNDKDVARKDIDNMRSFMSDYGFTDEEVNSVSDYRHVLLIRDAMTGKKVKTKVNPAKKKVLKAKKLVKPNKQPEKSQLKATALKGKLNKLKETGKQADAEALFFDMLS